MTLSNVIKTKRCLLLTNLTLTIPHYQKIKREYNIAPTLKWSFLKCILYYSIMANKCMLRLHENLKILNFLNQEKLLNKLFEFVSKCRHKSNNQLITSFYKYSYISSLELAGIRTFRVCAIDSNFSIFFLYSEIFLFYQPISTTEKVKVFNKSQVLCYSKKKDLIHLNSKQKIKMCQYLYIRTLRY